MNRSPRAAVGWKRGVAVCGNDIRAHCGTHCLVGAAKAARKKHQEGEKPLEGYERSGFGGCSGGDPLTGVDSAGG